MSTGAMLDWQSLGLDAEDPAQRRCLIEASAGTGKTWTISALYLRLVLERGWRARQIAVTTFTDAAAQELRERVRARLAAALDLIGRDPAAATTDDPVRAWLHARWQQHAPAEDAIRLRVALSELDQAPIGTIHSLCLRMLADAPFALGGGARLPRLVEDDELRQEIGADLVRALAHGPRSDRSERAAIDALLRLPGKQQGAALDALLRSGVELRAAATDPATLFADAAAWAPRLREFAARPIFRRAGSALANQILNLAAFLEVGDDGAEFKDNGKLDASVDPAEWLKPEAVAGVLADPVFAAARALNERAANRGRHARSRLLLALAQRLRHWRARRLEERGQLTFDALIEATHAALAAPRDGGAHPADALFANWPVALIDEFQDTDALQYGIFDAIYRDADGRARGQLVLIGDPKQAIYRFRGGDIHVYLRAAETCTQTLRLDVNHRSSSALVGALNDFHAACQRSFDAVHPRLRPLPLRAAGQADARPLREHGAALERPLRFHDFGDCDDETLLAACADRVAAYLQPGIASLDVRPLRAGDIAVLLPSNAQIERLRTLLAARRVPCVGAGRASVFDSAAARSLRLVLHAAQHPRDAAAVRAALGSDCFGLDFDALAALREDGALWRAHADRFGALARRWQRGGVLAVVDALVDALLPRLDSDADGERRLTDLRHLGELLQAQAAELHGREALLAWFAAQCEGATVAGAEAGKERLLRIESDQARVQLLTLHAAKGLEFPIVFLPLMSTQRGRDDDYPVASLADGRRVLDLGSEDFAAAQAEAAEEGLQERLRLCYVAMTRAAHACHVFVANTRAPKRAAHAAALEVLLAGLDRAALAGAPTIAWAEDALQARVTLQRAAATTTPFVVRRARRAHRSITSHSFTTLVHARDARTPASADDLLAPSAVTLRTGAAVGDGHPRLLALAPWRGAEFGTALHAIFERRDPSRPLARQHTLVLDQLEAHAIALADAARDELATALAERIDACLQTPIAAGLRLADLAPQQQRAELDFLFVLGDSDLAALRRVCAAHGEAALVPAELGARALSGYLTGKIDLVFEFGGRVHLLDYKSNDLGTALEAYRGDALAAAMARDHYSFQAFLYTLALDRYLRQRRADYQRERDLGDCFYLFVRAVGLDGDSGVWRHRFAPALIGAAQDLLAGASP
jgi:exodeoxyribonuclease V beta subunit